MMLNARLERFLEHLLERLLELLRRLLEVLRRLLESLRRRRREPSEPGAKLVDLMHGLSQSDTPKGRTVFYRELLASSLRIAAPAATAWQGLPEGESIAVKDTPIRFIAHPGPDGKPGMLVFTGRDAVLAWRDVGCETIELEVPELCRLALQARMEYLIINVCGPSGGLLGPNELAALAKAQVPGRTPPAPPVGEKESLPSDEHIELSRPPSPPSTAMSASLRAEAAERKQILSTYLVQGSIAGGAPRLFLAMELERGTDPDRVVPAFLEAALRRMKASGSSDKPPDVIPVEPGSGLLTSAKEHGYQVYYRRRR
jgi:hypothetical protein